jgi:predicted nuclease of predicted toxin-antitoxin system
VSDIDLDRADDLAIWRFARERAWVIVSKDEDFQHLSLHQGPPPQLVWVRLGNCRKAHLLHAFDRLKEGILEALAMGEALVEVVDFRP